MGRYHTDEQINAWRERAGFQSTRDVIRAAQEEREAEENGPQTEVVSVDQAMAMLQAQQLGAGGGNSGDVMRDILEEIRGLRQDMRALGTIG